MRGKVTSKWTVADDDEADPRDRRHRGEENVDALVVDEPTHEERNWAASSPVADPRRERVVCAPL